MKLGQLVKRMEEILKVSAIEPDPASLIGENGQTLVLNTKVTPSYAENQNISCQLEELEMAQYTVEEGGKKITFLLKQAGKTTVILTAADKSGTTVSIPLVSRLNAPKGLTVQQHGGVAEIKWEKVSQAEKYRVYVSTDGGTYKECGNTSTLIFVYSGLQEGITYRWQVMAVSGGEYDSVRSEETAQLKVEPGSTGEHPPTESPAPTGNPKPTGSPGTTESPDPTGGPKPTESPKPSGNPEPTDGPRPFSASIRLNCKSLPLQRGKTTTAVKLKSSVPAKARIQSAKSSRPSVASVKVKKGILTITGKKTGTAMVTVTGSNGASAQVKITVKKKVAASKVLLNRKKAVLKRGKKLALKASKTPATATDKVTWTSSDKKIASVNAKGVVKAKKKGKVTITAKTPRGKKASCKITVR